MLAVPASQGASSNALPSGLQVIFARQRLRGVRYDALTGGVDDDDRLLLGCVGKARAVRRPVWGGRPLVNTRDLGDLAGRAMEQPDRRRWRLIPGLAEEAVDQNLLAPRRPGDAPDITYLALGEVGEPFFPESRHQDVAGRMLRPFAQTLVLDDEGNLLAVGGPRRVERQVVVVARNVRLLAGLDVDGAHPDRPAFVDRVVPGEAGVRDLGAVRAP